MGDKELMPGSSGGTDTNLRDEIEILFQNITAFQSDIYKSIAMGMDQETVVSLFTVGFYPKWNSFYKITLLGFDKQYEEQQKTFTEVKTRAANEITAYMDTQNIAKVKAMMKTFDDYTEHVKDRKMIKVRS